MYISDDKSIFDRLYAEKDVIEKELGLTLDCSALMVRRHQESYTEFLV